MLGITSFVGAQVCSQNQYAAVLCCIYIMNKWKGELFLYLCMFMSQCIHEIKGTWRSDVIPLSAEFASEYASSAIFGHLYANYMLLLQPTYRSHNYSNLIVWTNLCLNFVCMSIYSAKKWSRKPYLNYLIPKTLFRDSSGFLSDLDQLCSPRAK